MDIDFWASRVHSSKHLSSSSSSSPAAAVSAHLTSDSHATQGDPEERTYFTCPFCYTYIELSGLCNHLQEEHCFDVKNAVCPVCALNLGKDVAGHFKVHHSNSVKHVPLHRRAEESIGSTESYYGFKPRSRTACSRDTAPDPVLSPFLGSVSYPEPKSDQAKDTTGPDASIAIKHSKSSGQVALTEGQGKDTEERIKKAEFLRGLIMSIIF